jgi:2',3'-cyclic-nucleotide 2'-phosphodiesterase (5'-nucleotidase family)
MFQKRLILRIAILFLALIITSCAGVSTAPGAVTHLAIIDTSDLHSTVLPYKTQVTKDGAKVSIVVGGMDRIGAVAERTRKTTDATLLVTGGDNLMGFFFRTFDGVPEITSMNMAGYDVVTLGNHDFDLGVDACTKAIRKADFPIVSSNITTTNPELAALFSPYLIKEVAGVKIGFFGLMTPDLPRVSSAGSDVVVDDDLTSVSTEMVRLLREKGVDLVVALTHVGKDLDETTAREVAGIDIIVGGHSHDTFYETVEGPGGWKTIIVQAGVNAKEAGILTFDVAGGRVKKSAWETVLLDETAGSDPKIAAYLKPYQEELDRNMNKPVGESLVDLDALNDDVRGKESNLGDLVTDAWVDWFSSRGTPDPIAMINGGTIRGNQMYGKGPVSYGDLLSIHPFSNTIYEVTLSGKELLSVLEMSASAIRVKDDGSLEGERIAEGGFLQVSGLRFVIDLKGRPFCAEYDGRNLKRIVFPGQRVRDVMVKEKGSWVKLDPNKDYTVLVTSWTAGGGDGYYPFINAEKKDTTVDIVDALLSYIKANSPVKPVTDGRIVIEGSK